MSPTLRHPLLFTALILAVASRALAADPVSAAAAAEVKRVTDRYAMTKARIGALLDQRLTPTPLPANPPNPFYQAPKEALADPTKPNTDPAEVLVPETADLTDGDSLRKYATGLKIGGVITRNGQLHLTINNTASKAGDVITVGSKDRPVYLKLVNLTTSDFTLGLNDATLTLPLRK